MPVLWYELEEIKEKKSKISVNSNFKFSSYAWFHLFHCSHGLLC